MSHLQKKDEEKEEQDKNQSVSGPDGESVIYVKHFYLLNDVTKIRFSVDVFYSINIRRNFFQ